MAVGRAGQVGRVVEKMHAARWPYALHLMQKTTVPKHHGGRNVAAAQQFLGAVKVGQHAVQQVGALRNAGFNFAPLGGRQQQRQRVHFPQTVSTLRVGVDVVRDTVFANFALHQRQGFADLQTLTRGHRLQKRSPMRTRHTRR